MSGSRIAVLAAVLLLAALALAPAGGAADLGAAAAAGPALGAGPSGAPWRPATTLARARVRVSRGGRLGVLVGCSGDAAQPCTGVAVVRARVRGRSKTVARRRFRVAPGRERVIKLKLRPAARRALARRRSLRAVIALRPGGAQPVTLLAAR